MALRTVNNIKSIFSPQSKPAKGLFFFEKVVMVYLAVTLLYILLTYAEHTDPVQPLLMRAKALLVTLAVWGFYRIYPSQLTVMLRAAAQLLMLAWWYPDTYQLGNILPNLDHIAATAEQNIFGSQPALHFSQSMSSPIFSELMYMGYASYFPLIALTAVYIFLYRREKFCWAINVIISSFFIYYTVFVLLPVTGPQYYYLAVGQEQITQGIFPNVHHYFHTHTERMTSPGYTHGLFYHLVEQAHAAAERPTAAFPSSHVGITVILLLLAARLRCKPLLCIMLPFAILMLPATVYIRAHYVIDAIAGLITAPIIFSILTKLRIKT